MDISGATVLSAVLQKTSLSQQVDMAIARKVMDVAKENSQSMIQMMERSVDPNLGGNVDLRI